MGQAFRRASGRIRTSSSIDPMPSTSSKSNSVVDRRSPIVGPSDDLNISKTGDHGALDHSDGTSIINAENVLEDRDPKYDAMLTQMVGRITSKPGGKPEIGKASVVEKYNKPMPKLRNTKPDSGTYEERPVPAGSLNVAWHSCATSSSCTKAKLTTMTDL